MLKATPATKALTKVYWRYRKFIWFFIFL